MSWEKEFYKRYVEGNKVRAFEIRDTNLPNKLYKYQGTEKFRLDTLENNELFFFS